MYKYRIYSKQIDFLIFFRDGFQSDLETGWFALADSEILLQTSDAAKTQRFILTIWMFYMQKFYLSLIF